MEEVKDGIAGLAKFKESAFDFIITDLNMSNMSGLDLLEAIRADEALKHIPVLLVASETEKENIIEAMQAETNSCVVKPFTADVLKQKIDKIFT